MIAAAAASTLLAHLSLSLSLLPTIRAPSPMLTHLCTFPCQHIPCLSPCQHIPIIPFPCTVSPVPYTPPCQHTPTPLPANTFLQPPPCQHFPTTLHANTPLHISLSTHPFTSPCQLTTTPLPVNWLALSLPPPASPSQSPGSSHCFIHHQGPSEGWGGATGTICSRPPTPSGPTTLGGPKQ